MTSDVCHRPRNFKYTVLYNSVPYRKRVSRGLPRMNGVIKNANIMIRKYKLIGLQQP